MGKSVTRVGDVGAGNYAKLANQIMVAGNIAAMGEAFVLAQKAGLDPEKLYRAIKNGLAGSHVLDAKIPLVMARQFEPGFKIHLHQKDLKNVLETARATNVSLPLTALVQQMFTALIAEGKGEWDHGALVQFAEKLSGVTIQKP
jgi:2-hydroxy-3-oxopropionate reductase